MSRDAVRSATRVGDPARSSYVFSASSSTSARTCAATHRRVEAGGFKSSTRIRPRDRSCQQVSASADLEHVVHLMLEDVREATLTVLDEAHHGVGVPFLERGFERAARTRPEHARSGEVGVDLLRVDALRRRRFPVALDQRGQKTLNEGRVVGSPVKDDDVVELVVARIGASG